MGYFASGQEGAVVIIQGDSNMTQCLAAWPSSPCRAGFLYQQYRRQGQSFTGRQRQAVQQIGGKVCTKQAGADMLSSERGPGTSQQEE